MNRPISIRDYSFSNQVGLFWAEDSIVLSFKEELRRNLAMPGRRRLHGKQSGNLQVPEAIKETGTIARTPGSDTAQPPSS